MKQLHVVLFLLVTVQALALALDPSIYTWPVLSSVQTAITWARLAPLADELTETTLHVAGAVALILVGFWFVLDFVSMRQVMRGTIPGAWIVKLSVVSYVFRSTVLFVPLLAIIAANIHARLELTAASVVICIIFSATFVIYAAHTVFLHAMSQHFSFSSTHVLARQHSRLTPVIFVLLAAAVVVFVIPGPYTSYVRAAVVFIGNGLLSIAVSLFTPYYKAMTNMGLAATHWAIASVSAAVISPLAALALLLLTPLAAIPPLLTVIVTDLCTQKFREEVMALESTDMIPSTRPSLLFPFQVEVALRRSRNRMSKAIKAAESIQRRVPVSIFEFPGAVSENGILDKSRLSPEDLEIISNSHRVVEQETGFGMRLFTLTRARWPHSPYLGLTFVLFSAAFRKESLASALYSTERTCAGKLGMNMDVQYYRFLVQNYTRSLSSDEGMLSKLEAQRDMSSLTKAQKKLTDELTQLWSRIGTGDELTTLAGFKNFMQALSRVSTLNRQIRSLYDRVLARPTPRVFRTYAQYISLMDPRPAVESYSDELFGMADELEVAPGDTEDNATGLPAVRVDRVDRPDTGIDVLHHAEAVGATLLTLCLVLLTVGTIVALSYLHNNLMWQFMGLMNVNTGLQSLATSLATLRSTYTSPLVATSLVAGPPWRATLAELAPAYQRHALDHAADASTIYGNINSHANIQDIAIYEVFDSVNETWFDTLTQETLTSLSHLLVNVPRLLRDKTITVPVYEGLAPSGTMDVSAIEYLSSIVHTAEYLRACVIEKDAAGSATSAFDCIAEKEDLIMGFERAMVQHALDGILDVSFETFAVILAFPVIEVVIFAVILFLLTTFFPQIEAVLYVRPMLSHYGFALKIRHLLAQLPSTTIDRLNSDIASFRRSLKVRSVDLTRTADSQVTSRAPSPCRNQSTVLFNLPQSNASLQSRPTGLYSGSPSQRGSTAAMLPPESLSSALELVSIPRKRRFATTVIKARSLLRMAPPIIFWMAVFSVTYTVMVSMVIYYTGVVTMTSITVFYQDTALVSIRNMGSTSISYAADQLPSYPTPLTAADAAAIIKADLARLGDFIAHLSGDSPLRREPVEAAWERLPHWVETPAMLLIEAINPSGWVDGEFEDEITDLLYREECLRFNSSFCTAPYVVYTDAENGLINAVSAFMTYMESVVDSIDDGSLTLPDYMQHMSLPDLDLTSGLFRLKDLLIDRNDESMATMRSSLLYFVGLMLFFLALFYYTHFYKTIVRIGHDRVELGQLFRSIPRGEIPPQLLEKLLDMLPEE
ncbi:hypothetical protein J8273_8827 [Carpediemonas membranifera]|uniref:Uncharacterized protein n=1 Tax=Carpediemonas membranifera TaxID=201153 RepID=A0A8J6AZ75_9EUKA|nr:hypothetical protein J8273_8827 [Carpediemonas membranifera]|eukprot:KAG9389534.1 hypothetical protein J8273_8827 [Carpediemonas membranifera]